ncbi:MAG: hypothetical protein JXA33_06245 [Anaerolineae bacterium]|nr:hypothetical protein [Anaerolineae bacterium]
MTHEVTVINVSTEIDIVAARVQLRNLARALGFDTIDQARISLATSSLAHFLDLGSKFSGEIRLVGCNGRDAKGIKVVCLVYCGHAERSADYANSRDLEKVRWMVDELEIEELPSQDVQVALLKWMAR